MRQSSSLLTVLGLGIAAAGFASVVAVSTAAAADQKPTVSKALAKPLKAAQEALQAKKYADAIAKLRDVQNMPGRTAFDDYTINEMLGYADVRTGNYAEAARVYEATLDSGYVAAGDVASRVRALAQLNYQTKNYDKAIEFGNRSIKGGYADDEMYTLVGQAYYVKGDLNGTLRFMNKYVDDLEKAGRTPKEQSLQIIMSACAKKNDDACTTRSLESLVARYPKPEYWQNLLYSLISAPNNSDNLQLNIFRLAAEVDILKRPDDYTEMAQLAMEAGLPGEAQAILEKGFARNLFSEGRTKDKNARLLESARKLSVADKASLPSLESQAKSGDQNVKLGMAYLSYEQFDKAAAAIQRGIAKGGVKNPEEASIALGIAQLHLKNKEEALKAFRAAKGDSKLSRVASLWALHAQQS
jgi:outer membrane protein assembly factor BamD (BamD/ComL family)